MHIRKISVQTFREGAAAVRFPPLAIHQAQYSLPWAVAAAAVDGELGVYQVREDRLSDGRLLALL